MKSIKYTANFKRDYVAHSAVIIFCLIIVIEVIMSVAIPLHLERDNVWANQIKKQQTIELFDLMRAKCSLQGKFNRNSQNELGLILDVLNLLAIYMRSYRVDLSPSQVDDINQLLIQIDPIIDQVRSNKAYSEDLTIEQTEYMKLLNKKFMPKESSYGF